MVFLLQSTKVMAAAPTEIYKDGSKLSTVQDAIEINNSTFVPMRNLFETFKADVQWNKANQTVIATNQNTHIQITIGSKKAFMNGKQVSLGSAPVLKNGTVFVPLRFISESFHSNVGWITLNGKKFISINSENAELFQITHIRDGDTFSGVYQSGENKGKADVIRLIGVDTPETVKENTPVQYYGPEASAYTKKQLTNKTVYIVKDQTNDKYGRTLAYVFLENGQFFNAQLVSLGYAKALSIKPNTQWELLFSNLEKETSNAHIGLWTNTNDKVDPASLLSSLRIEPSKQINEDQLLRLLILFLFPETKTIFYAESFYRLSQDEQFKETTKIAVQKGILATSAVIHSDQPLTKARVIEIIGDAYDLDDATITKIKTLLNGFSFGSNNDFLSAKAVTEILEKINTLKEKVSSFSEPTFDALLNN